MPEGLIDILYYAGVIVVGAVLNVAKAVRAGKENDSVLTVANAVMHILGAAFSGVLFGLGADFVEASFKVSLFSAGIGGYLGISALERVADAGMGWLEGLSKGRGRHGGYGHGGGGYGRHRYRRRDRQEHEQEDYGIDDDSDVPPPGFGE